MLDRPQFRDALAVLVKVGACILQIHQGEFRNRSCDANAIELRQYGMEYVKPGMEFFSESCRQLNRRRTCRGAVGCGQNGPEPKAQGSQMLIFALLLLDWAIGSSDHGVPLFWSSVLRMHFSQNCVCDYGHKGWGSP